MSFREIASRLQIGVGTAHRIYTRFVDTGEVSPAPRRPRPDSRKLDDLHELFIIAIIAENPTLYLSEICSNIYEITNVTVCHVLHKNGCSRKKLSKVAKQRSSLYRGDFMAYILQYSRDFFVWTDETCTDRRDQLRKFDYSLRGEPAVCCRILSRGTRILLCVQ